MNIPTITEVTRRVYRKDTTYVIYKVRLSDGRMHRFDVPFNGDLTDSQALAGSRPKVEEKLFQILQHEAITGRYHCCGGFMPKHEDNCQA